MAEGRSVRDWASDLATALRDTAGSQPIWSFTERYLALQEGFRQARGHFSLPDVYTSLTLVAGVREYGLPRDVRRVSGIDYNNTISLNPTAASTYIAWKPLRTWHMLPSVETNRLWIENEYPGANLRIYFERDVEVPPVEMSLWTNITATNMFIPVANTTPFRPYEWPMPGYVIIEQEVIKYELVTASSFTGLTRGMFNTAPRANSLGAVTTSMARGLGYAHSSNLAVTPFLPLPPGGSLDQYISNVARQQLYLYRMNDLDSEGNRVVATLAAEYGRQSAEILRRNRPFNWPRAMTIRFPRRR